MTTTAKKKTFTKTELCKRLSEVTGLKPVECSAVINALPDLIVEAFKEYGEFTIAKIVKLRTVEKPAQPARQMPNPFKPGEVLNCKAKPARKVVKAQPLKLIRTVFE